MSSSDTPQGARLIGAAMLGALLALSACTVKPLYADRGGAAGEASGAHATLRQIAIKPVQTRYGQEVRNRLIFLFGGGAGNAAEGVYSMTLVVTAIHESAALVQSRGGEDNEPTAGTVTVTGSYSITDSSGTVVARGSRSAMSSYDRPSQEFAQMRAERDAEDRAARELAEILNLAVAQQMANR